MRIVFKLGTRLLTKSNGTLDKRNIIRIVDEIGELLDRGCEVIIVSSGAIGAGYGKLKYNTKISGLREKQALASVGQTELMNVYKEAFSSQKRIVGQLLITLQDLADRTSYLNIRNTLFTLLKMKVIPIINENDSVAVEEIKFGDNDHLASIIASKVDADKLVILTDVDGLMGKDGKVIKRVDKITDDVRNLARGRGSDMSVGGMITKIEAAKNVTKTCGIDVHLVNGRKKGLLGRIIDGGNPGTVFTGKKCRFSQKKRWILFRNSLHLGKSIIVDSGAVKALVEKNSSLLPVGIKRINGEFNAGSSISCVDEEGKEIARGLVNYSSDDLKKIIGKKSSEIKNILGYKDYDEVINKDNLVLM